MTQRRILQVVDTSDHGGAQQVVLDYLENLKKKFSFAVAVLGKSGRYSKAYTELGIPVFELGSSNHRWSIMPFLQLMQMINAWQPDIVHTHLFKSNVLGVLAARIAKRKSILHDHTGLYPQSMQYYRHYFPNEFVQNLFMFGHRLATKYCSKMIVLTSEMAESYHGSYSVDPAKICVLPNGIDLAKLAETEIDHTNGSLRKELNIPAETKLILNAGRLEYEKGWMTYLEVAKEFSARRNPPCLFLIAGSGSEEVQLKNFVQDQGLRNVYFLGYREDILSLLRQSDMFLSTALRESFGLIILEAMAVGCPVVATESEGPRSIISHGVNGLLAAVGDVRELASCVASLLSDCELKRRVADNASNTIQKKYALGKILAQMAEIYHELAVHV